MIVPTVNVPTALASVISAFAVNVGVPIEPVVTTPVDETPVEEKVKDNES